MLPIYPSWYKNRSESFHVPLSWKWDWRRVYWWRSRWTSNRIYYNLQSSFYTFSFIQWYSFSSVIVSTISRVHTMLWLTHGSDWLLLWYIRTTEMHKVCSKAAISTHAGTTSLRLTNYRHAIANWSTANNEPKLTCTSCIGHAFCKAKGSPLW